MSPALSDTVLNVKQVNCQIELLFFVISYITEDSRYINLVPYTGEEHHYPS